ncbi:DUF1329 domain-containing protein [Nevskia ramosa]|uniref:DUF1329 domain-containing protein n=1 Tax=Nevskia ramosa TaxID=64002 RepID=UPI00235773D7|nr:DUF1329 domain-containing protein [Nevskia ramosa]
MRIRKYDFNYSRRAFAEKVAKGLGAGVLAPLWPLAGRTADVSKAYPDELLSIEVYTKGKIKPGDVVTASNVDVVKDLLDPIAYMQIKEQGRRINICDSTKDMSTLFPNDYFHSTLKNRGRGKVDSNGNLWTDGVDGHTWIGGLPFPDAKNGLECCINISQSWGRHDYASYPIPMKSFGADGKLSYRYDLIWFELQTTCRNDGAVFGGMGDRLRLNTALINSPAESRGTTIMSSWFYDQRKFPELYGYLPAFRRVRQFPTNQRFEPLVPGVTFFLSDAWGAGDPSLTWGNFKIVERKPMLAAVSGKYNWQGGKDPDWDVPYHGGPAGQSFQEKWFELVPEAIVWDSEPTGYPRAPVGVRRTWSDARSGMMLTQVTRDRQGKLWKQIEFSHGQMKNDKAEVLDAKGHPEWSWNNALFHDIQSNRLTWMRHYRELPGGYKSQFFNGVGSEDVYNKFFTTSALQRLGAV